jgi:photosystem II stability/assembly factor-like uncharacterized protein
MSVGGRPIMLPPTLPYNRRMFTAAGAWVACLLATSASAAAWRPLGLQGAPVRALAATAEKLCAGTEGRGVACLDAPATSGTWRGLGPEGVTVTGLWLDPLRSDLVFAATDGEFATILMFRSLDNGRTWEPLGSGVPFPSTGVRRMSLVAGVPGSMTVLAGGGAVWRSDDLGESWSEVLARPHQNALEVSPADPAIVWVGGGEARNTAPQGYAAVSRNGGVAWNEVGASGAPAGPTTSIAVHPQRRDLVLAGHAGAVRRTNDGGASFQVVLHGVGPMLVEWDRGCADRAYAIAATAAPDPAVYVSADRGATWAAAPSSAGLPARIHDVAADARRPGVLYAATSDGVYALDLAAGECDSGSPAVAAR